jgi:uncharacterized membrane protein YphA (DoxX/SURF4 family)
MPTSELRRWYPSAARIVVGGYWLYFASQKWPPHGVDWMRALITANPAHEPVPGLRQLLQYVVAPNWHLFAVGQGVAETLVAALLLLGLATRLGALLGTLLAAELALTVAFLVTDGGFQWLYYLAVLVNLQVLVAGAGPLSVDAWRARRPQPPPS